MILSEYIATSIFLLNLSNASRWRHWRFNWRNGALIWLTVFWTATFLPVRVSTMRDSKVESYLPFSLEDVSSWPVPFFSCQKSAKCTVPLLQRFRVSINLHESETYYELKPMVFSLTSLVFALVLRNINWVAVVVVWNKSRTGLIVSAK